MSTRAYIARPTDEGWQGNYNHSDGYPTELGKRLHNACREFFGGDVEAMLRFIIDEHPGGWSSLSHIDPAKTQGYPLERPSWVSEEDDPAGHAAYVESYQRPTCYCHSDRPDDRGNTMVVTQAAQTDLWDIEWTYICTPDELLVFQGCKEMEPVGAVRWDEEVSDERWGKIECGERYERCKHYAWLHIPDLPEEYRKCSMDLLMGHRTPEPREAIAFDIKGVRVEHGGSGHSEGWGYNLGYRNGERPNGHRWFGTVIYPDGTRRDVPLWSQKTGAFCAGVTPIYPKTLDELDREKVPA